VVVDRLGERCLPTIDSGSFAKRFFHGAQPAGGPGRGHGPCNRAAATPPRLLYVTRAEASKRAAGYADREGKAECRMMNAEGISDS
jgi:hypothetical protein